MIETKDIKVGDYIRIVPLKVIRVHGPFVVVEQLNESEMPLYREYIEAVVKQAQECPYYPTPD